MKIKLYSVYFLLSVIMLSLISCGKDNSLNGDNHNWDKELFFGAIPMESEALTRQRYTRFVHYLEKELGSKVTLVVPKDYAGVIDGLAEKKLHFGLLGPKSYIEATKKADVTAVVRIIGEGGQDGYKSVIIVKKGAGLKTIADLKGKTWAFTDPHSTSGNLIPSVYFAAQAQIEPDNYFSKVIFSGSHQNSIEMVKKGEIDAAATHNLDVEWDAHGWNKDDFDILWESRLIPYNLIAYRTDLSNEFKNALEKAAVAYSDKQGLKDMAISKFIPATDEDYVFVRQLNDFKEKLGQAE